MVYFKVDLVQKITKPYLDLIIIFQVGKVTRVSLLLDDSVIAVEIL